MNDLENYDTTSGVDINNPRGPWICTNSGINFYPLDPAPSEVSLYDIAKALSQVTRFGGHCGKFYSVAEHSVRVSDLCNWSDRREGLMHDATEAYIGDMVRPLKYAIPQFLVIEDAVWSAISNRFNLNCKIPVSVKVADNLMCAAEKRDLMSASGEWDNFPTEEDVLHIAPIQCWSPEEAEQKFLERAKELEIE